MKMYILCIFSGKLNFVKNVFAIAKPGWSMQESVEKLTKVYHNVGKGLSAKSVSISEKLYILHYLHVT